MKKNSAVLALLVVLVMGSMVQPREVAGGSGVTIYVVPTVTDDKILPATEIPSWYISSSISVVASPGEYEAASFVVRADGDIESLQVEATDLGGAAGSMASSSIDIRVVKCWYQSGTGINDTTHKELTPELLLKDDSLVKVENGENYLKMIDGEYRWISDPTPVSNDVYPYYSLVEDFPVNDSDALQPVDISGGENKQFWVTVEVPEGAVSGVYDGVIRLRTSAGVIGEIQLEVEVLGIELLAPGVVTSIAYHGFVASNPTIGPYRKSETQYRAELADLLAHGVTNPSVYEGWNHASLGTCLRIRNELGMGGQPIYCYCGYQGTGNSTDPAELEELKNKVASLVAFAGSYGVTEVYIYGIDEAEGELLTSQRAAWEAVHEGGGKVWTTSWPVTGVFEAVGDVLDLARVGHAPDAEEAAKWHSVGHQIFSYSNPQGGLEDPEVYRRNYGLLLWQADYDGGMTFAYNVGFGNTWNDFDSASFRDHCMVYPTVNGEVDTIQWEGFREGVDDLRYLNTLMTAIEEAKAEGRDTAPVEGWLADLKSTDLALTDLDEVRAQMIGHILSLVPASSSDTVAPLISGVEHSHVSDWPMASTTVTWTTDERSTSQVEYGTTAQLGQSTVLETGFVRQHSVVLSGLEANGGYYFRVKSSDASGNEGIGQTQTLSTVPSAVSIGFASPTDGDGAVVGRDWTEVNTSVDSTYETSSFIDWNQSLVGFWNLNESSGSIAVDGSSYGQDAVLRNGPQWSDGMFGNGLSLDGVDDYVNLGNGGSLNVVDAITVECWVKPTDLVGYQMILSKVEGSRAKGYWCYLAEDELYFAVGNGTDYQEWNVAASLAATGAGHWVHIVGTFASNDKMAIYVNGVEMDSRAVTGGIASTTASVYLSNYSNWRFGGLVDEVRIWDRVLSPEEIRASCNTSACPLRQNFGDLADGPYQYYAYTTDSTGASAQTETRTITIYTAVQAGDANGDGMVNAADITRIERIVAGLESETPGADANGDGSINTADLTRTERIIAGLN